MGYSPLPFAGTGFPSRMMSPDLRYTAQPRSFVAGLLTPNVCVRPPPAELALLLSYFQSSFFRNTTGDVRELAMRVLRPVAAAERVDDADSAPRVSQSRRR